MTNEFKGGNSRQLAKTLDSADEPLAVLDRRGHIVFVNAALCAAVQCQATVLVGKQCRWDLAADSEAHGDLLNALAPPEKARNGQLVLCGFPRNVIASEGSSQEKSPTADQPNHSMTADFSGQLFVPLLDKDRLVHMTIVLFADWEKLDTQFPEFAGSGQSMTQAVEQSLALIRKRWDGLDDLTPLLGESPAIGLAMRRAQLAASQPCHVVISGPKFIGKRQIAQGIFQRRLKLANCPLTSGTCFPIDVSLLDSTSLDGMLEVFVGRLRRDIPAGIQLLLLDQLDRISDAALHRLHRFLKRHVSECTIVGLSDIVLEELNARGPAWTSLASQIADVEIYVPAIRERRQDIPVLVQQFLAAYCRKTDRALVSFSPAAMDLLVGFGWPRNLHQLQSAVESSVEQAVLTNVIDVNHLPVDLRTLPSSIHDAASEAIEPINLDDLLEEFERTVIERAIRLSPRNRAQVARLLGISRTRLLRRISHFGLDASDGNENGERKLDESMKCEET